MPKVLIADAMSPLAADALIERGCEVDVKTGLAPEDLFKIIGDYDGIAVRSSTKLNKELLASATNLKVVGRAGIGVDNIDVPAATAKGVVVMNTPFGNAITTAEHAIAMLMAVARQIPQANASTHAGRWEKSGFMGVEVMGKTLGLVGCGNIGTIVADRAQGLKMRVIAYDPYLTEERARELGVEKVPLSELFARADFITLHTPLTDATRNIINADAFAQMKQGVRLVNCARGGLVDEAALVKALDDGTVAGVALDVFETEPAKAHPLFGHSNVVATPHLGASTTEAQEKVAVQVAEQMADFLIKGAVANALNMPAVTAEEAPRLTPYMTLASQLGSFAGQATEEAIREVSISYEGDVSSLNVKPLTAVVLQGLLAPTLESVNMVSAPVVAKERDIHVKETRADDAVGYQTRIAVTVTTDAMTRTIAGTLYHGRPRVTEIKGIQIDAHLGAHMLYITNQDKPGLIGALGSLLGDAGINIATFNLGRAEPGGDAIALIEVDQVPSTEQLAAISTLDHIKIAKALRF